MRKNLKKNIIAIILIAQITFGMLIPMVRADDDGVYAPPPITPSGSTSSSPSAESLKQKAANAPSTNKFEVTKYLTTEKQDQSYLKSTNPIGSFIIQAINFLVLTIGSLCFLSLVVGGFVMVISNGDENLVTKGKDIIKYAIIGLAIVLCSYLIIAFVQSLFYELPGK